MMSNIQVMEKALSYNGHPSDALELVKDLRFAYNDAGRDMPKMLSDFVFAIEVELQSVGYLDTYFNELYVGEED